MPFERVRNLVAFSFQHAPLGKPWHFFSFPLRKIIPDIICNNLADLYLDVLEASQIAWPNPAMWRQVSLIAPYYAQPASPQLIFDGQ